MAAAGAAAGVAQGGEDVEVGDGLETRDLMSSSAEESAAARATEARLAAMPPSRVAPSILARELIEHAHALAQDPVPWYTFPCRVDRESRASLVRLLSRASHRACMCSMA